MNAVNILVDVHCHRPSWVFAPENTHLNCVTTLYRFYVDNNLLTERTWIWDNATFIQENIWIYAETNSTHILTIEPVLKNPAQAVFTISNFTVNTPFTSEQINDLTISFTL
jgi:hypothetical protein